MARIFAKKNFPVGNIRPLLEPGPIVLVSSQWKGRTNIMTMGWHAVMEFTPSLVGCVISAANHSFEMIRRSKECVINISGIELAQKIVGIGNCSGAYGDKFADFDLTPTPARLVKAPLIKECFANLECRIFDTCLIGTYNYFIFKIVAARAVAPAHYPKTLHYHGEGMFTASGKKINLRRYFSRHDYLR